MADIVLFTDKIHAKIPRVVLCHGTFDLLHLGHIRHLKEAKAQGDRLVVSVTADKHVGKGNGRPHFNANQRMEALRALDCVDDVFINDSLDAVQAIEHVRPAVYVKGIDYAGKEDAVLQREIKAAEKYGGIFHITKTEKWSSSRLLNGETLSEFVLAYLDSARKRDFLPKIQDAFKQADGLTVAFVGE